MYITFQQWPDRLSSHLFVLDYMIYGFITFFGFMMRGLVRDNNKLEKNSKIVRNKSTIQFIASF